MKKIDARGLACPAPVLQTKSVLEQENPGSLRVCVDNAASQQNVQRYLESQGFQTVLAQEGADYLVTATGGDQPLEQSETSVTAETETRKIVVMCSTDRMGYGDDDLGQKLMVNFLRTLEEMAPDLWRLVLVNNGVKMAIDDSEVLQDLQAYEQAGIKIMVCGTCLNHFDLLERKRVGETTKMLDIITAMQLADKVITI